MMKKIILVLFSAVLLISSGCGLKSGGEASEAQDVLTNAANSFDMSAIYTEEGNSKEYYPADSSFTEEETAFYVEGNACVLEDYILGKVAMVGLFLLVAVGPNCYDTERFDAMVGVDPDRVEIEDYWDIQVSSLVRIYYEFPDGFVPDDYLDYMDYATYIISDDAASQSESEQQDNDSESVEVTDSTQSAQ